MFRILKAIMCLVLAFVISGCDKEPALIYDNNANMWEIPKDFIYSDMTVRVYKLEDHHWRLKHGFSVDNKDIGNNRFCLDFERDEPDRYVMFGIEDMYTVEINNVYDLEPIKVNITGGYVSKKTDAVLDNNEIPLIFYRMEGAGFHEMTIKGKEDASWREMTLKDTVYADGAILYCISVQFNK